jgi:hypothetical protein
LNSTGIALASGLWHDGFVPDKPTSEGLRRAAETLRQTAIKLIEHAAVLIEQSAQLEKQVSLLKTRHFQRKHKTMTIGEGTTST